MSYEYIDFGVVGGGSGGTGGGVTLTTLNGLLVNKEDRFSVANLANVGNENVIGVNKTHQHLSDIVALLNDYKGEKEVKSLEVATPANIATLKAKDTNIEIGDLVIGVAKHGEATEYIFTSLKSASPIIQVADINKLKQVEPVEGQIAQLLDALPNLKYMVYNEVATVGEEPNNKAYNGRWQLLPLGDNAETTAEYKHGDKTQLWAVTATTIPPLFTPATDPQRLIDGKRQRDARFSPMGTVGSFIEVKLDKAYGIEQFKWVQSNKKQNGVWKLQGENSNGVWADISNNFNLGGEKVTYVDTTDSINFYDKVRLVLQSGTPNNDIYLYELNFKLTDKPITGGFVDNTFTQLDAWSALENTENDKIALIVTPTNGDKVITWSNNTLALNTLIDGTLGALQQGQQITVKKGGYGILFKHNNFPLFHYWSPLSAVTPTKTIEVKGEWTGVHDVRNVWLQIPTDDLDFSECDYVEIYVRDKNMSGGARHTWGGTRYKLSNGTTNGYMKLHYDAYATLEISQATNKIKMADSGREIVLTHIVGYKVF